MSSIIVDSMVSFRAQGTNDFPPKKSSEGMRIFKRYFLAEKGGSRRVAVAGVDSSNMGLLLLLLPCTIANHHHASFKIGGHALSEREGDVRELPDAAGDAFSRELRQIRVEQGELESKFKNLETHIEARFNSIIQKLDTQNMIHASGTAPPIEADVSQDHEDGNAPPLVALAKALAMTEARDAILSDPVPAPQNDAHTGAHDRTKSSSSLPTLVGGSLEFILTTPVIDSSSAAKTRFAEKWITFSQQERERSKTSSGTVISSTINTEGQIAQATLSSGVVESAMPIKTDQISDCTSPEGCVSFMLLIHFPGKDEDNAPVRRYCPQHPKENQEHSACDWSDSDFLPVTMTASAFKRGCSWINAHQVRGGVVSARLLCPLAGAEKGDCAQWPCTQFPFTLGADGPLGTFQAQGVVEAADALSGVELSVCALPLWGISTNRQAVLEWGIYHRALGVQRVYVPDQPTKQMFKRDDSGCDWSLGGFFVPNGMAAPHDSLTSHADKTTHHDTCSEEKPPPNCEMRPFNEFMDWRMEFCMHEHWKDKEVLLELSYDEFLVCDTATARKTVRHRESGRDWKAYMLPRRTFFKLEGASDSLMLLQYTMPVLEQSQQPKLIQNPKTFTTGGIHGATHSPCGMYVHTKSETEQQRCTDARAIGNGDGVMDVQCIIHHLVDRQGRSDRLENSQGPAGYPGKWPPVTTEDEIALSTWSEQIQSKQPTEQPGAFFRRSPTAQDSFGARKSSAEFGHVLELLQQMKQGGCPLTGL
jgi:hypothetical protein